MSVIEQAKRELALINFGEEDSAVMVDILERFFGQWDSGGAVFGAMPVLARLISAQPLSPLTGEDSEWHDPMGDGIMLQNVRCGSVFKDWRMPDGNLATTAGEGVQLTHDIDALDRMAPITFPYDVAMRMPADPVMTFDRAPWDHPTNRSHDPVEQRAAEIYAAFAYDGPDEKPVWIAGGNSIRQDEAREQARQELRAAGHGA